MTSDTEPAWFMPVREIQFGHDYLGFDYPMSGDQRPSDG